METLREYYKSLNNKKVAFIGLGVSHSQLIEKFLGYGSKVTICDKKEIEELNIPLNMFYFSNLSFSLGSDYLKGLENYDIIFRSPGVEFTKPEIQDAVKLGICVTSEIEEFFKLCPCKIIGITGSDGKTTTSSLIYKILNDYGHRVWLGGNIGKPMLPIIDEIKKDDLAVVELSSFQLISMKSSPYISVITNITPNHLDHHKDMNEYIDAKRNIIKFQKHNSIAVLNIKNEITASMRGEVIGELREFGLPTSQNGAYTLDKDLFSTYMGKNSKVFNMYDIKLKGNHNFENIEAAYLATRSLVSTESFISSVASFKPVEHRIEFVSKIDGVEWYNDSIATTPSRTIAGLRSFDRKVILIAGGSDKGLSFDSLAKCADEHVKTIILMGITSKKILDALSEVKSEINVVHAGNMSEAVRKARENSIMGDIVLLSPASPSFDMYANFEERGRHFKKLVLEMSNE
ncbi:MAG: UDP-N-acetylmuramoyl-L-alanine--D-glutamate ligase [Ruminococcaceae bacterium]|nr:UDP-N-acetylmuramoyl-L-alanine--D-glutamate ligase [Oscillospiraceae bacterium]